MKIADKVKIVKGINSYRSKMNNPEILSKISKFSRNIFFIALTIFLVSLLPITYNRGFSNGALTGGAGGGETTNPPEMPEDTNTYNGWVTIFSAAATLFGGFLQIIPWFSERTKYKTMQIQNEMQMREIEKMRLELELEKKSKAKKKSRVKK